MRAQARSSLREITPHPALRATRSPFCRCATFSPGRGKSVLSRGSFFASYGQHKSLPSRNHSLKFRDSGTSVGVPLSLFYGWDAKGNGSRTACIPSFIVLFLSFRAKVCTKRAGWLLFRRCSGILDTFSHFDPALDFTQEFDTFLTRRNRVLRPLAAHPIQTTLWNKC